MTSKDVAEDQCNICKKEAYLNPTMKLLKSIMCGHKWYHYFFTIQFQLVPQHLLVLPCPVCKTQLRKANFFDESSSQNVLSKEISVRRKIEQEWNMREEDFENLDQYNDYLEQREDMIFNLLNGVDVEETQAKIALNREKNKALIQRNQSKKAEEDKIIDQKVKIEQEQWILRRTQFLRQDQLERLEKLKAEAEYLDGLSKGVSVDELDKKLHQHKATASTIAAIELQEQELREAEELAALQAAEAEAAKRAAQQAAVSSTSSALASGAPRYEPRRAPLVAAATTTTGLPAIRPPAAAGAAVRRDPHSASAISAGGWQRSYLLERLRQQATL